MAVEVTVGLAGLLLGFSGAWFISRYALPLGLIDLPNERSSHRLPTPRGGGIGLAPALLVGVFLAPVPWALWGPALALALLGYYDDLTELHPLLKLACQILAAGLLVVLLAPPQTFLVWPVSLGFGLLFIVATTNFFNFMDGINGLAGLTGLLAFTLLALFALQQGREAQVLVPALAMLAACAGFLPWNLPRAKVFLGDGGSLLLGFLFAGLSWRLAATAADLLCCIGFLFPFYADTLSTLWLRWRAGEPLLVGHRRHLYQVLCNELGHPHWQVSCGYVLAQLLVAVLMLLCYRLGIFWQLLLLTCSALGFVLVGAGLRRSVRTS
jgi:Fuc2NAc and GlcNAc transferase